MYFSTSRFQLRKFFIIMFEAGNWYFDKLNNLNRSVLPTSDFKLFNECQSNKFYLCFMALSIRTGLVFTLSKKFFFFFFT